MIHANITIITIYVLGIILGAIGFGIWQRGTTNFDWFDDAVPAFCLLLVWPIALAFFAAVGALLVVCYIPCWFTRCLMKFGAWIGNKYDDWSWKRYRRKVKEEHERVEQIQKNVEKMQKVIKKTRKRKVVK